MKKKNNIKIVKKNKRSPEKFTSSGQIKSKNTIKSSIKEVARLSIHKSAEKHKDIIENIQEGIFEVDLIGHFTFLNNAVCHALGYKKDKLIGINSRQFTHKDDVKKVMQAYTRVYKTGEPFHELGWHITRKNGEKRYIEGTVYLRRNSSGKPIGYRVIAYDFTERKKMEDLLRKSEAQYRLLADHMKDQIWLMDLNLGWKYISPSVEKLLGYTLEELLHLPLNKLLTEKSFQTVMDIYSMEMSKAQIAPPPSSLKHVLELGCFCKDGPLIWIECTLSFIQDEDGKPLSILGEGRDITDRKKMEEILRQSEEKYRNILENIQEGYFEVDLAGNFTFFNDAVCEIYGYPKEELMSINYRRYMDKETAKKAYLSFNKIFQTGNSLKEINWQIIRKDGSKRYIDLSTSLLKNSSDQPIGFRGLVRDITDRKEAEAQREAAIEALIKSEKYFKEITENSSDILIITREDGNIKYCSRSIERFTGYKPEELIGKNAYNFIHPEDVQRAADEYAKAIQADETMLLHNGFRVLHKNGSEVYLDGLGRNLLNNPDIRGFVMNVRDITDRKLAEEKLREEQQRFKALAEQSSEIILLVNGEGIVTYLNPAIEKVLGFTSEETLGIAAFSLIHPDDMEKASLSFKVLFDDKDAPVQRAEVRVCHKDGSWRTFDVTASNLVHDNKIQYAMVNLHDITERKKAIDDLHESRQRYRELSIIDDLSHLYNSRHFYTELKKETERSNRYNQPLTLLLMDLDKFKVYNDTYGHLEGDNVLSRFGQLIKKCLRENDSAYRYGGEEFTILLPMTTYEEGIAIAQRIQTELRKENFSPFPNKKVYLTVSIGLSQYQSNEEIKSFVQRVDQLMYKVKKTQRGQICSDHLYMQ